jgi:hypothetical protein
MTYYDNPSITDWHKQIIMGTVLGGSSLVKPKKGKNCYIFMRCADKKWLEYKAYELSPLASQRPFTKEGNTIRWHSNCYPVFTDYYNLFYKSNKKAVNMDILDSLRDIGLAIWYADCGKLHKNKIILNTNKFGEEGTKTIVRYFDEVGVGETNLIKERQYTRLEFSPNATTKFLLIVANRIPDFMHAKLLPK